MAFTDFYCQSGGSNINSGSTTNNTAAYTSTNGNWSTVTHIFTPTDGSTPASTVSIGDWASVYNDGATVAVYIVRITNVAAGVNGAITTSSTAFAGTAPTTSATGRSIKVGGAWLGPNAASGFPFTLGSFATAQDASANIARVNMKNDATYSVSAQVSVTSGQLVIQGYSSSTNDGGRAIVDGSTNAIKIWAMTGQGTVVADLIFVSSASSGSTDIVSDTNGTMWFRCVFHGGRGNGLALLGTGSLAMECEAYGNNTSNTSGKGGFSLQATGGSCVRCVSHDNTGSNTAGFVGAGGGAIFANCIADTNGGKGINVSSGSNGARVQITACDIYNNGSDGIGIATGGSVETIYIENTNLLKNTGAGINVTSTAGFYSGFIFNVAYGSGTQANGSSDTIGPLIQSGSITYASGVTPWVDPENGDFRINLPAANFAGRGAFTETAASYSGTVGYPDVGAAQSLTGGGGTFSKEVSYGFA